MPNLKLLQADAEREISIGMRLRLRREELVWSVDEVVRKTGIPKHAITAIDQENYYAFWGNAPVQIAISGCMQKKSDSLCLCMNT